MTWTKWDARFIGLARHVATWSKDPSTRVGSVVAFNKRLMSVGYNGFPEALADINLGLRSHKYPRTVHAERNALDSLPGDFQSLLVWPKRPLTLYVTHPPCGPCALSIIGKPVGHVVYDMPDDPEFAQRWDDVGLTLLGEAGIAAERYPDEAS